MSAPTWEAISTKLTKLPDLTPAVITGVTTAAFYAVPDIFESRRARALAKAAALIPGAITSFAWARAQDQQAAQWVRDTDDIPEKDKSLFEVLSERPALATAIGAGAVSLTAGGLVLGEKLIYRFAEHRASQGVDNAHTKNGLILGALSAVLTVALQKTEEAETLLDLRDN